MSGTITRQQGRNLRAIRELTARFKVGYDAALLRWCEDQEGNRIGRVLHTLILRWMNGLPEAELMGLAGLDMPTIYERVRAHQFGTLAAYREAVDAYLQHSYGVSWADASGDDARLEAARLAETEPAVFVEDWAAKYDLDLVVATW